MDPASASSALPNAVLPNEGEHTLDPVLERRKSVDHSPPAETLTLQDSRSTTVAAADIYPDGGLRAWLTVLGSALLLFPTYGFMQSVGTVQSYLELHQLAAYTPRDIGWIPGVYTFLGLLFGIQIGPIFDRYGPRIPGIVGTALYIPMFFLLAECKVYWHFMLCLGVLGGLGASIVSTVAMSIVSNWFIRRRGLAVGITMCGSSVGGVVIPILLRHLFDEWGWAWAIRTVAFVVAGVLVVGNFLIRPNPKLKSRGQPGESGVESAEGTDDVKARKATVDLSAFSSLPFTLITVTIFCLEFVIFGATGLLPTYATIAGFAPEVGFYMIAILNAGSSLGRCLPGLAGDYLGSYNVLGIMIIFTLIVMGAIWLPFGVTSLSALYAFSALYGFGTGSFLSITPVCMGKTCHTRDYGRYFGTMYFVVSFSLLITVPLGGQILEELGPTVFGGFYMAVLGFSGLCFLLARWAILDKRWILRVVV